jgi:tetratricopeptide (TPR) repeat protein
MALVFLAAVTVAARPASVRADPATAGRSPNAEAREHFEHGVALTRSGDFVGAVRAFEAAYALSPKYPVLYNLGQALATLGRPVEAKRALEKYLQEGGDKLASERRRRVEELVKDQERRLGFVSLQGEQQGIELTLDGERIGTTPLPAPVPLAGGRHQLIATLPGFRVFTKVIEVEQGTTTELALELSPEPAPVPAIISAAPLDIQAAQVVVPKRSQPDIARPLPAPLPPPRRTGWLVATGATGIALGTLSASLKIWNDDRYDAWHRERVAVDDRLAMAPEDLATRRQRLALYDRAASIQAVDDVALTAALLGATALVTFGILWLTGDSQALKQRAAETTAR